MAEDINQETAWSLYWSQDRLHSCVASQNEEDQRLLDTEWARFASSLSGGARVLDLATGNGAVAKALLAARDDLRIDAVDRADIDPLNFLSDKGALHKVSFHPQTDILNLPFEGERFDAISSQFGIEYAGLSEAGPLVGQLLKRDGKLLFFIHHAESELILASRQKKIELEQLVGEEGLLSTLQATLGGKLSFADLEQHGAKYLEGDFDQTQAVSGQVFKGIEQIISLLDSNVEQAHQLAASMDLRVRSEYQRLCQMIKAAQTERSLSEFSELMAETGITVDYGPLSIGQGQASYLLCWRIQGTK
ncbi:MAG: hypothetical protein ACR2QW_14205 [bacterium]